MEDVDTVVIGAGQAGLVMSYFLRLQGREHVVLERARIAERWRSERWDSLRFQFSNRYASLPGMPYDGDDPEGFMLKDEVVARIERYARLIQAPVRLGVEVRRIEVGGKKRFLVHTTSHDIAANNVICACGPYQAPLVPSVSAALPARIVQITANRYSNPDQLPPGGVLVVGTGASGAQIAEDLIDGGRDVYVSVGKHGRIPRRYRGRDVTDWLDAMGPRYQPADGSRPLAPLVTGIRGGYDLDLRNFATRGAVLLGKLEDADGERLRFADNLAARIAEADKFYDGFCANVDALISERPDLAENNLPPDPEAKDRFMPQGPRELHLGKSGIASVIWATGYRHDLGWLPTAVLDERGNPVHQRGVTPVPGLFFLGLLFQHSNRSSIFWGVQDDAAYLADRIGEQD